MNVTMRTMKIVFVSLGAGSTYYPKPLNNSGL